MNFLSRLKFDLCSGKHANVAHAAEDCLDSRPVRAEIRQLGFKRVAELDCSLSFLVLLELPVDEGKEVWRLVNRERLGLKGRGGAWEGT